MTPTDLSISQGSLQLLASAAVFPLQAELGWISITAPLPSFPPLWLLSRNILYHGSNTLQYSSQISLGQLSFA